MPKAHFPSRGGPNPTGWNLPQHVPAPPVPAETGPAESRRVKELENEVQKLRQELARARQSGLPVGDANSPNLPLMWMALGLCGLCLIFTLFALWRHG